MIFSKWRPCLLKQPLKKQKKVKEWQVCIKMQCIPAFLDITKVADFQ